jgi:excisionase family DNA binding protein
MDSNEKMLSVKEVAYVLGVSRDSVSRLIRRGELKAVRLPRMGGRGANRIFRVPESMVNLFRTGNMT